MNELCSTKLTILILLSVAEKMRSDSLRSNRSVGERTMSESNVKNGTCMPTFGTDVEEGANVMKPMDEEVYFGLDP